MSGRDVIAGISVGLVLIPQSMAYAELAGMPSHHGLYAATLAPIAAAFFASSPYLQTGPGALTALLTLGALLPLAPAGSAAYVGLAALLALVVGVVRVIAGLIRGGWISYLMSRPMLLGFTSGAAILIMASQLPGALGVTPAGDGVLGRAVAALMAPNTWNPEALGITVVTIAIILGALRIHPLVPGVLVATVVGIVFSVVTGYEGATVGSVPTVIPPLSLDLPWAQIPALIVPGGVIALIGFSEAASISRVYASEDRQRWDANREFLSQGAANIAAAFSGGFPVGGSFARSSIARRAGGRSRWTGLAAGIFVLLFLPFAGIMAPLPRAVLSGIVISAIWGLLKLRPLLRFWVMSPPQAVVGWGTFGFTLLLSPHIEQAVLLGVGMAGTVHLWRELTPGVAARRDGDTLHLGPNGVLWYGSAPALEDAFLARLAEERGLSCVVIHCGGLGRIDLSGALVLAELVVQIEKVGLTVEIEGVPAHAERVLDAVGIRYGERRQGPGERPPEQGPGVLRS